MIKLLPTLSTVVATLAGSRHPTAQPAADPAVRRVTVIDMPGAPARRDQTVLIAGTRYADVEKASH
jgi:hypothetical protein